MRLLDDPVYIRIYNKWAKRKQRALEKQYFQRNMNDALVLEKGVLECAIQEYLMLEEKKQMVQTRLPTQKEKPRRWDKVEYLVKVDGDFVAVSKPRPRKDRLWDF